MSSKRMIRFSGNDIKGNVGTLDLDLFRLKVSINNPTSVAISSKGMDGTGCGCGGYMQWQIDGSKHLTMFTRCTNNNC